MPTIRTQDLAILEDRLTKKLQETIVLTVNGKIDRMANQLYEHVKKHEADFSEIRPLLQGVAGAKILSRIFMSVGSLVIMYFAIKNNLFN